MIRAKPTRWALHRTAMRLVLAAGLASAAWLATRNWVAEQAAAASEATATRVEVLVAAHPIEAGTTLAAADLRWQPWPADAIDRSWLVRGAGPAMPMRGMVVQAPLAAGVPITRAMAVSPGNGSGFAAAIRPGWRAATIAVTPAAGLAGFVAPGDRVDLLLTQTLGNRRTVQTLLADLGVLGVDQRQRGDAAVKTPLATAGDVVSDAATETIGAEPPNLITLEVTPRQAEAIAVAVELGKLSLTLRGPGRDPAIAGGRRWDSDVTGLSAVQLAAGANNGAGFAMPAAAPPAAALVTPAASPAAEGGRGVEIVYGAPPASAAASEPAK